MIGSRAATPLLSSIHFFLLLNPDVFVVFRGLACESSV